MKLIYKFKSPNFDERKGNKVMYIIIHYTALKSVGKSIDYLCSKKNKVSSHYIISKKGEIYNLVSETKRAWHAGLSYWKGNIDINSLSIGIELDYFPETENTKYSNELISSLIELLKRLTKKYSIDPINNLGHSDVAPYRKIDPGKNFPWYFLEENKLSYKILRLKKINNTLIKKWFNKNKFYSEKKKILFMLDFIGYDTSLANINKLNFKQLIINYSNHFKYYKSNNLNKANILHIIELHFLNILLTKFKKQLNTI